MIPFNFKYYRPANIEEAVELYQQLKADGEKSIYYAGGTEIVTNARDGQKKYDALIDLKDINECLEHGEKNDEYVFGACLTLNEIVEKDYFPLFSLACRPVADHTTRNQLTMGGNICGKLPYREVILPLMLVEANFVFAGPEGMRTVAAAEAYDKRMLLNEGEFLVQVKVPKKFAELDYHDVRKVKQSEVDYPLLHLAALKDEADQIRIAFSSICAFPFRLEDIEAIFNDSQLEMEEKVEQIVAKFPIPIKDDKRGSADYRRLLLGQSLAEIWHKLGGDA